MSLAGNKTFFPPRARPPWQKRNAAHRQSRQRATSWESPVSKRSESADLARRDRDQLDIFDLSDGHATAADRDELIVPGEQAAKKTRMIELTEVVPGLARVAEPLNGPRNRRHIEVPAAGERRTAEAVHRFTEQLRALRPAVGGRIVDRDATRRPPLALHPAEAIELPVVGSQR